MSKSAGSSSAVAEAKRKAQAEARAQARRRAVGWTVAGVVVVAMFAALVAYILRQGAIDDVAVAGPSGVPVISSDGGLGVGSSGVAGEDLDPERARLDVYFDFICPWCARFEISQAETLDEMRSAGVVYTPTLGFNGEIQDPTDPASIQWTQEGALRQALLGG